MPKEMGPVMMDVYANGAHMIAYPVDDLAVSWAYVSITYIVYLFLTSISLVLLFENPKQKKHGNPWTAMSSKNTRKIRLSATQHLELRSSFAMLLTLLRSDGVSLY